MKTYLWSVAVILLIGLGPASSGYPSAPSTTGAGIVVDSEVLFAFGLAAVRRSPPTESRCTTRGIAREHPYQVVTLSDLLTTAEVDPNTLKRVEIEAENRFLVSYHRQATVSSPSELVYQVDDNALPHSAGRARALAPGVISGLQVNSVMRITAQGGRL